jgi:hypothetical protein
MSHGKPSKIENVEEGSNEVVENEYNADVTTGTGTGRRVGGGIVAVRQLDRGVKKIWDVERMVILVPPYRIGSRG